ncbi:hypothetical protein [Nonomuraea sp. SYSU D8015]|uniref:hypothetical protein n=1 Tax=Nonomuraea sp. SYSU D8015 TaxID=2593644 RepID=UPI00166067B5|nr:hypothetical protein [Nonomuraea sp. SYSU D8015]
MAKTIDGDEASIGWTVQSPFPKPDDVDHRVGNTFTADQLPDPEAQRAAGIDPDQWKRGIVFEAVEPAEAADEAGE